MADDIWAAGVLDTAAAYAFPNVSPSTFRTLARREGWLGLRRYLGTKPVYPRVVLVSFLAGLAAEPPPELRARARRIGATMTN